MQYEEYKYTMSENDSIHKLREHERARNQLESLAAGGRTGGNRLTTIFTSALTTLPELVRIKLFDEKDPRDRLHRAQAMLLDLYLLGIRAVDKQHPTGNGYLLKDKCLERIFEISEKRVIYEAKNSINPSPDGV